MVMSRDERLALVEATWQELGYRVEAPRWLVWVRTLPPPRQVGLIWLPPKKASFYGELPHLVTVHALVLAAGDKGPAAEMKPGDLIAFKRLEFGHWRQLESRFRDDYGGSEEFVGFIDSNHVVGFAEETDVRTIPVEASGAEQHATG